ncbi:hypothetical protein [Pseudonocardia sp. T1-2H]|uniref:hypothetical protein n=1 Tax=Pseudonocardia sp. T1-2H TaxID=3128899 RepID=UPI003100D164
MLPLPVLVNDPKDFWNYAGTIADAFAGVGAVAAFMLALWVFRRQLDDNREAQASKVSAHNEPAYHSARAEDNKQITV